MAIQLQWREQPVSGVTIWSSLMEIESRKLAELARGKRVLEIGAAFGFSTSTMAAVAKHVWSVDRHDIEPAWGLFGIETPDALTKYRNGTLPVLRGNLSAAGLENKVTICVGYSQRLLVEGSSLSEELTGKIDLAFIDGDHTLNGCYTDLINCSRIVRPRGFLAIHDYGEATNPDVKSAVDAWRGERRFSLFGTLAVIRL